MKNITLFTILTLSVFYQQGTNAFTQKSPVSPMGHEWLTRTAFFELINETYLLDDDPLDPRDGWQFGLAKNMTLAGGNSEVLRIKQKTIKDINFESKYKAVYSAVIGERWVDIAGFNVSKSQTGQYNCWDAVAQEPAELQQDHFMRSHDDAGNIGGLNAAKRSQQRFVSHFVNAVMATSQDMKTFDGGTYSTTVKVDRNYFLLGRAMHLLQDSFSSEHTVRSVDDNFETVQQVKSYLCAQGSEQHSRSIADTLLYKSGDVIWKESARFQSGWNSYKPSNMKTSALVALEASKDLWAAFFRSITTTKEFRLERAKQEADRIVKNWMNFDAINMETWYDNIDNRDASYVLDDGQQGPGISQQECMRNTGEITGKQSVKIAALDSERKVCLFNLSAKAGYGDLNDPLFKMPLLWQWKSRSWLKPSDNWAAKSLPKETGKPVLILDTVNQKALSTLSSVENNSKLYNVDAQPIEWIMTSDTPNKTYFRARNDSNLFLAASRWSGAVKLSSSAKNNQYQLFQSDDGWNLYSLRWKQYMWFNESSMSPLVTRTGDAANSNSRWIIQPIKE
jgi:hypothetical protein